MSRSQNKKHTSETFALPEIVFPDMFHASRLPQMLFNAANEKLIDVNAAWEKLTGLKKSDVLACKETDLNVVTFKKSNAWQNILSQKEVDTFYEAIVYRKDTSRFSGLVISQNISFHNTPYLILTILDISPLKIAEAKQIFTNNFSEKILDSMYQAITVLDANQTCIKVNKAYCKLTGYKESDIIGTKPPFPHWPPEHYDAIGAYAKKGLNGVFGKQELTFKKSNGNRFQVAITSTEVTDNDGEVVGYISTSVDISEILKSQNSLREKSQNSVKKKDAILQLVGLVGKDFKETLNNIISVSAKVLKVSRVSVWQFNTDETAVECLNAYQLKNDAFESNTIIATKDCPTYFNTLNTKDTIRVQDVYNSDLTQSFIKDYLEPLKIKSLLDIYIKGSDGLFGIICFEQTDAKRRWTDEDEDFAISIANIVSLAVENHERQKAETNLILEKEFSEELVGSLVEGLAVVSLDKRIIRVNNALCEMTGFSEQELLGDELPFKYWPPESADDIVAAFVGPEANDSRIRELTFMRKNGERFPVSLAFSTIKDKNGHTIAYFATINDITEKIKTEKVKEQAANSAIKRKGIIAKLMPLIGQDYETTLQYIMKLSADVLDANQVHVWRFKNANNQLVNKWLFNAKTGTMKKVDAVLNRADFPDYFNKLDSKSVLTDCMVSNHPMLQKYKDTTYSEHSCVEAIIHSKDANYGLISFENPGKQKMYSHEEENFVASIATIISLMVESKERTSAERELIKSNEKLQLVNKELNTLKQELEQENTYLREEIDLVFNYEEMVYSSKSFSDVLTEVERVASTKATVLLLGESGTGKELLARAIHNTSSRKNKPLIKVNCAAIPRELIESELFGHKKGSFTGAISDKLGKFQLADGGTLFLDEIGELPIEMQPKLLRAIQESEVEQIGDTKTHQVDIRIIAATNRDLKKEIKRKNFREDLFFRINVFPINIPPLRDRIEDIPILIEHFANKFSKLYNKNIKYISEETKRNLQSYAWPGNIRELENLIERAVILSSNEKLMIPNFKFSDEAALISATVLSLDDVQRIHIEKTLKRCQWKIDGPDGASELLEIKPSTLRDRMKKLGIQKP